LLGVPDFNKIVFWCIMSLKKENREVSTFKGMILTVKQVAEYLQIDEHTVYRLAKKGEIPAVKIAGQWRFKKDLIDKWLEEGSLKKYGK